MLQKLTSKTFPIVSLQVPKVSLTETVTNSNDGKVPIALMILLDYFVSGKGMKFSKVSSISGAISALETILDVTGPQSYNDILRSFANKFGSIEDITGIRTLCRESNVLSFEKGDSNEWDVLMIIYNEFQKAENFKVSVDFVEKIVKEVSEKCGSLVSINLQNADKFVLQMLTQYMTSTCVSIQAITGDTGDNAANANAKQELEKLCEAKLTLEENILLLAKFYYNQYLKLFNKKDGPIISQYIDKVFNNKTIAMNPYKDFQNMFKNDNITLMV
jgi:hypothetical protein